MQKPKRAIWIILADIHANYQALMAVWEDAKCEARKLGLPEDQLRYISLGDVVDYGPDPVRCLEWVEEYCEIKIRGNHDLESSRCPRALPAVRRVSQRHWPVTIWTRCELEKAKQRSVLCDWTPMKKSRLSDLPGFILAHADFSGDDDQSLRFETGRHRWIYKNFFKYMHQNNARFGLIGHSHQQLMFQHIPKATPKTCFPLLDEVMKEDWQTFPTPSDSYFLINPGSVGQPRPIDEYAARDPRAKYMLLDTRNGCLHYKFKRVNYPWEETAIALDQKVRLPEIIPCACDHGERFVPLNNSQIEQLRNYLDMQLYRLKLTLGVNDI